MYNLEKQKFVFKETIRKEVTLRLYWEHGYDILFGSVINYPLHMFT